MEGMKSVRKEYEYPTKQAIKHSCFESRVPRVLIGTQVGQGRFTGEHSCSLSLRIMLTDGNDAQNG